MISQDLMAAVIDKSEEVIAAQRLVIAAQQARILELESDLQELLPLAEWANAQAWRVISRK